MNTWRDGRGVNMRTLMLWTLVGLLAPGAVLAADGFETIFEAKA